MGAGAGRLVLGAAGAVIGGIYGGPTGAQIGWAAGSALGGAVFPAPAQKVQGPRLSDLKVTGVEYGQPIPYLKGMMRVPGQVWWSSARREIAHTTTTEDGGKGGGQEVERTDYTYEVDMLFGLTSNEIAGVTRVWLNGKLVWTNLSAEYAVSLAALAGVSLTEDEANAALTASGNTNAWRRITVYTGASNQMPDPTYEASVGTENAIAYRGRGSVFIEGLQLGSSGVIPNLTFEVFTRGVSTATITARPNYRRITADGTLTVTPIALISLGVFTIDYWTASANNAVNFFINNGSGHGPYHYDNRLEHSQALFTAMDWPSVEGAGTTWRHLEVTRDEDGIMRTFKDGVLQDTQAYSGAITLASLEIGRYIPNNNLLFQDRMALFRVTDGVARHVANFTRPSTWAEYSEDGDPHWNQVAILLKFDGDYTDEKGGTVTLSGSDYSIETDQFNELSDTTVTASPEPEDLPDIVSALCVRAGLGASQIDVTGISGSPSVTVRGMAITQITSTRSVIEMLMQAYFFEAHVRDKIYFVSRGGSSVETIDFEDMGATESEDPETFQLVQGNDIEFPAQVSLTYANWLDDYQNDTQESDRLVSAVERSVSAVQLPLALIPSEAKTIANKLVLDQYVSLVSSTVRLLGEYGNVEPTDIITPTDKDGNTYRMRVVDVLDNYPVLDLSVVMDNATVLTHTATTSSDYEPTLVVEEPPTTLIELMDIPILRDVDDDPGFYAAMKGSNQDNWPGGALFQSFVSDTDFSEIKLFQDSAVFGTCVTTLGDWNSGRLFDMQNTVIVNVGEGTLSSSTRSAVLNDSSINAMLIGSEVIQFITATLVLTGIYTLSGLLRGCTGTEWAMTGHSSSERCVLLRLSGLRRISMQSNELGQDRYYAGVTIGRSLSSGLTGSPASGELFVNTGKGLAPYNPVYLRYEREANGDITITGQRRSRLAVRMIGSMGINVPDDDTTSWLLDILSNEGSPQTVYRTLTGSVSGTEITWTYSAADQAADFGSPTVSQLSVGAYGYSSTVGRGEGKFKTGAV